MDKKVPFCILPTWPADGRAIVRGRNGAYFVGGVEIRYAGEGCFVELTGIGARGKSINGGFLMTPECFEQLAWAIAKVVGSPVNDNDR